MSKGRKRPSQHKRPGVIPSENQVTDLGTPGDEIPWHVYEEGRDPGPGHWRSWADPGTGKPEPREFVQRLEEISPGLATRLSQGLSHGELRRLGPAIAQAMKDAGAPPGTYSFSRGDPEYGSKVIVLGDQPLRGDPGIPAAFRRQLGTTPAKIILGGQGGGTGLPHGLRPGDMIAADQPLGYTEADVTLPGGSSIPAGSKVWRADEAVPPDDLDQMIRQIREMLDAGMSSEDVAAALVRSGQKSGLALDQEEMAGMIRENRAGDLRAAMEAALDRTLPPDTAPAPVRTSFQAEDVLNRHARLADRYRSGDENTLGYLLHLLNAAFEDDPDQAARMHYPVQAAGRRGITDSRQMAVLIARGLREALTYQVTAPMVAKMRQFSELMPGVTRLDEGDLPAPEGFAWLDDPWDIPLSDGILPVRAVSWEKITVPSGIFTPGARSRSADAVRMVFWIHLPDAIAYGHFTAGDPRVVLLQRELGGLMPHHVAVLPFNYRFLLKPDHEAEAVAMIALLHSLWVFLGTELSASRTVHPASHAHTRKILASIRNPRVKVVTLRRVNYIYAGNGGNGHRAVNRTCKWMVRDFHRHIDPYRDEDADGRPRRHEAKPAARPGYVPGDDHDVCGVCLARGQTIRIALVRGHRRGPAHLPWKTSAEGRTVYRLAR